MMPAHRRRAARNFATSSRRVEWAARSEEHTSELQSQSNLVCRLLLEKKKKQTCSNLLAAYCIETHRRLQRHRLYSAYSSVVRSFKLRTSYYRAHIGLTMDTTDICTSI